MLSSQYLLKSQKNTLMEILVENGLDPKDFTWKTTASINRSSLVPNPPMVSVLMHRDPQHYFVFDYQGDHPYVIFSPGMTKKVEDGGRNFPMDIGRMFDHFRIWAGNLRAELDTPDYWHLLEQGRIEGFDISRLQLANDRISQEEFESIRVGVENLHRYISAEFDLTHEQQSLVEERLQYLVEASTRLGKKDWIQISLSVGLFLVSTLQSDPTQARAIWGFIKSVIQGASKLLIQ